MTTHHTSPHGKTVLRELSPLTRKLRAEIPEVYEGFIALSQAAFAEGELSTKFKELIAVAIAITHGCDGCIASHARMAAINGATPKEAAEAIGVAYLMNGGPASIYGPRAFDSFMEFYEEHQARQTARQ